MKYICAVLLLIGTGTHAWAGNCTYKVWDVTRNKWQPYVVQDQNWVVPPAPERSGYTFVGWHCYDGTTNEWPTKPNGSYMWDSGEEPTPSTYYIHPIPNSAGNDDNKHTAKQGETEMFAIYRPDASTPVSGWTTNSGWTAPSETQITITFKPNSGTPGSDQTQQILSSTPTHLSPCMFTRVDYEFAGWGTSSSLSSLAYADCHQVTFTSNQTLYAEWVDDANYSIHYELTGMTKVDGPTEAEKGAAEFEANFSFNTNYGAPVTYKVEMQEYYSTYEDITEDCDYDNGYLYVVPASGITGNIIVTMSATEKTKFTVSYDKNGATSGSAPAAHTNVAKNATVTIKDNTGSMAKTGHTFNGWNILADGSGTNYAVGSTSASITSDVVLYAKWVANEHKLAVANADNVDITATPSGGAAITEGNEADVAYGTSVTLAHGAVTMPHAWRAWKVTKTSDQSDVTMAVLDGSTLTMPDYAITVSCKLTGDYIAWCPEPTITLSGDIAVTAFNGRGIMAATPLHIEAANLNNTATVTLSSNNSDVYFSADRVPNFARAVANQPKNSIDLTASDGIIDTDVYVHYKPSSVGNGIASEVTITATWTVPDPDLTDQLTINVRSMSEKFVIATKVGANWYALPANMSGSTTPDAVAIEVNEATMTATAPKTCVYTLWPVKTTNTEYDRYAKNDAHYDGNAFGERVRFSGPNNSYKGLWANNNKGANTIDNDAAIDDISDGGTSTNTNPSYEWKIGTTVGASGNQWTYTLQTDQTNNQNYLNLYRTMQWGTYSSGLTDGVYFLPITEVEPFEMKVVEWYPTKVLVYTTSALTSLSPTASIDGNTVASPTFTSKGGNLYEIGNLNLEGNPTKTLTIGYTVSTTNYANTKPIPVIISRGEKAIADAPFSTLTKEIYSHADLVVRDGAHLTLNGTQAENEFYDVTIYPTSKISVPATNTNGDANKISVHSLTFFGGIDQIYDGSSYSVNKYGVPELSLKGVFAKKSLTTINYDMRVNLDQMYQMCVPYTVELADITYWDGTAMTLGSTLYVSAYDGQARADREGKTWAWEEEFESKFGVAALRQGIGYTISAEPQDGYGDGYSIIRMPMKSNIGTTAPNNTEQAKTVPVTAFANSHGQTISDNHKGWNYLGNPYMVSVSGSTAGGATDEKLVVGHLEETGTGPWRWVSEEYRYVTIPHDNGEDYEQQKWTAVTLKPFKSFFLQVGTTGELSFALASRNDAPARFLQIPDREVEFEIILSNDSHTRQDHMGLLIADQYSPAYEINADLEKMDNAMSVYTIYGGYNLAYNALSSADASDTIPVGYIANAAGTYTFQLDEQSYVGEVKHIWLTDYELHQTVDLLDFPYEFTTVKGRNETRFALTIELKELKDVPTNIEEIVSEEDVDMPIKFIYRDKMYILSNGIIFDATGKRVKTINK